MQELERLKTALKQQNSLVYECNVATGDITWSGELDDVLATTSAALASRDNYLSLIHDEDRTHYIAAFDRAAKERRDFRQEYRFHTGNGKTVWLEDTATLFEEDNHLTMVGSVKLAESSHMQHYLNGEYHFDPDFIKDFEAIIVDSIKNASSGAFLKISISNLPTVMSWYGKSIADQIIGELSNKISEFISEKDIIGHLQVDEIGVVLCEARREDVRNIVDQIHDYIQNYKSDAFSDPIRLRASIGGVYFPSSANNVEEAINKAYIALSTAKDPADPAFYCDYTEAEAAQSHSKDQIGVMHYMRKAVHQDKLRLAYQPIIESKTGEVASYECLLRIVEDDGKVSSAGSVIPIAEKMGFIDVIDQFVLERIVEELTTHKDIILTFNVSNLTTDNPKWLAMCTKLLSDADIASRVIVEITETAAQRDLRQTAYFVASLQTLGCQVALDDFGAGYTSFRQLKSLSVDLVKIDGTFVIDLAENSENLLFIKTLLDFNNCYGLKTIAECVETGEVAKILMKMDVDYLQGYYFGRPEIERPWEEK